MSFLTFQYCTGRKSRSMRYKQVRQPFRCICCHRVLSPNGNGLHSILYTQSITAFYLQVDMKKTVRHSERTEGRGEVSFNKAQRKL